MSYTAVQIKQNTPLHCPRCKGKHFRKSRLFPLRYSWGAFIQFLACALSLFTLFFVLYIPTVEGISANQVIIYLLNGEAYRPWILPAMAGCILISYVLIAAAVRCLYPLNCKLQAKSCVNCKEQILFQITK